MMKLTSQVERMNLFVILSFIILTVSAKAEKNIVYHNALDFTIIGRGFSNTVSPYDRLPAYLKDTLRPELWDLSKNSAGIAIRFRSNTTTIGLKWESLFVINMNHMAATGIRGLDLYAYEKDHWQYVGTARPGEKKSNLILISNMLPVEREYMLYLPLYDGTISVEIGIDPDALIAKPLLPLPKKGNPFVFYGTSLTQGGCVSRPGMAYPSIVERKMNVETINLGFSGNGLMDWEILDAMLKIDASCYIIDCLPNCDIQRVNGRGYKFISRLLKEKKGIPVIMVGQVEYTQGYFDFTIKNEIAEKNLIWENIYERLKNEGNENLYYIHQNTFTENDNEGTVDGRHLTDLGFQRFAEKMINILNSIVP